MMDLPSLLRAQDDNLSQMQGLLAEEFDLLKAHRAENAPRQVHGNAQRHQAGQPASQAQKEARRQELPQHQAADDHPQQRHPNRLAPAPAGQHDEGDDVGEARLDPRQRERDGRLGHRQHDGRRRVPRDPVVVGGGAEFDFSS